MRYVYKDLYSKWIYFIVQNTEIYIFFKKQWKTDDLFVIIKK